jgi:hypothetical protein
MAARAVTPDSELIVQAACRGEDPDLFAPSESQAGRLGRVEKERIAAAVVICARCPIAEVCLGWGTTSKSTGVWGGHYLDYGKVKNYGRPISD